MTTNHIADRQEPSEVAQPKVQLLQDKMRRQQMQKLKEFEVRMLEAPDQ